MALLVLPKLLGWMVMMVHRRDRRGIGGMVRGLFSVVIEVLISALIAPVMMLMQSRAVMEIVAGRDAGWAAQRRDDGGFAPGEFARAYAFPTMLGAAVEGVGLAQIPEPVAAGQVRAGKLVQVLKPFAPTGPGVFLYYPGHRQIAPKLRAFVDHIKSRPAAKTRIHRDRQKRVGKQ